jgi:undecaprenyl-diphosphatase
MRDPKSDLWIWLRRSARKLRRLGWSEAILPSMVLAVLMLGYGFVKLADVVEVGGTQSFDEWVLRSMRQQDDLAVPIGPVWLREGIQDVTALGSPIILLLMLIAVGGFMFMVRQWRMMVFAVVTTSVGALGSVLLKQLIGRDRPTVVPHLREVSSSSFPSGHAMLSAVVFLTLGILLMEILPGRAVKVYCLLWAMLLTFLVGFSRIYLGVHYPSDVLAGWMAGIAWALVCWAVAHYFRRKDVAESVQM